MYPINVGDKIEAKFEQVVDKPLISLHVVEIYPKLQR